MSKCDVSIVFDRPQRTYRAGDRVSGHVLVSVNRDVSSDGVVLEHYWKTHGRGNTDRSATKTLTLYRGALRAGDALKLPFDFVAAPGPPTYHGHYLNIDHYVKARVDIPWAFDPKAEEDYLLEAGSEAYGELPPVTEAKGGSNFALFGVPLGAGLLLAGVLCLFPFGFVLIPAGLIVLFYTLRKRMAERRIGKVALVWGPLRVVPGGTVPVKLAFTPRQQGQLNGITLKLTAQEICVSGSGTDRTTHTHTISQRTLRLAGKQQIRPHQPLEFDTEISVPQQAAYTFHAGDNKLRWQAELRIDLPMWPDWTETREIIVRPVRKRSQLAETTPDAIDEAPEQISEEGSLPTPAAEEELLAGLSSDLLSSAAATDDMGEETVVEAAADIETQPMEHIEPKSQEVRASAPNHMALVALLDEIAAQSRYSHERERIVERAASATFDCAVDLRRSERTYAYDAAEPYRNGRTVYGLVEATDHEVAIQLNSSRNPEVDELRMGDAFSCRVTPVRWNSLYDRLELREV